MIYHWLYHLSSNKCKSNFTCTSPDATSWSDSCLLIGPLLPDVSFTISFILISVRPRKSKIKKLQMKKTYNKLKLRTICVSGVKNRLSAWACIIPTGPIIAWILMSIFCVSNRSNWLLLIPKWLWTTFLPDYW